MNTTKTLDPVREYYDSWKDGIEAYDESRVRAILAPDLVFEGPTGARRVGAEAFLKGLLDFIRLRRSVRMVEQLPAAGAAAALYECEMGPENTPMRFAEFFKVEGGKITELRLLFDASQYRTLTP
jgi:ketosteroid isomerase-like protein